MRVFSRRFGTIPKSRSALPSMPPIWEPKPTWMARKNTAEYAGRVRFHQGSFASLPEAVAEAGFQKVDGVLADLGVSRYQLTAPDRGFSFMADGPLDMRMDQSTGMTAADLVNYSNEKTLADLIFQLGQERRGRK